MSQGDIQKLIDVIRKIIGLSPVLSSLSTIPPSQLASSPVIIPGYTKPKPPSVPFSGMAGYSERGAPEDWDTAMGEVYGYRWWYLVIPPKLVGYVGYTGSRSIPAPDKQHGILYGANNQPWYDGRLEAVCTARRGGFSFTTDRQHPVHQPPETREACGCGFWAYFSRTLTVSAVLSAQMAREVPSLFSYGAAIPVFGVVKGTGRIIIGEKGFRCQYAKIMGLCIPPVSVKQLSWWLTPGAPGHGLRYHDDDFSFSHAYESVWSGREECTKVEHLIRIASIETILSDSYPSARLFTSKDLLTQYFPPDKNYS